MLIEIIILIVCICILLLLVNKQNNNHIFHSTRYVKNIIPNDILISTRPIIKDKLVWVPPPVKYHHIKKNKGHIIEHSKIRDHKLIDNIHNNDFKNRINRFDNKYSGNNININRDFKKIKHNNRPKIEHFDSYGYGSMIQNPKKNCQKLNMTQCLKFQNCGYITTYDFNNRCVPGDPHGPLDKKIKYQKYYHNDPFTRALIANDNHYRDMTEDVFDIE